ncbi:hypothetical protein MTR67_000219 [Solanum verrucosum]|uniref:Uncharacterized protein n=1 Tax=Solanum verrucosum TaxID=315347 RepID=A0AAF0T6T0_SOLVR|nr:hypothetical protein MTR67_000219 [Solanum verrucosum]
MYTGKEKQTNGFVFSDLLLKKQEPVLVDTKIKEKAYEAYQEDPIIGCFCRGWDELIRLLGTKSYLGWFCSFLP